MEEISVYHKPGPFIYTVWDKKGRPLYVGGTEDVNAKSFKFNFEFSNITGHYYYFPDFRDEIDRQIVKLKPTHNTTLRSSFTKGQIVSYFRKVFHAQQRKFTVNDKKYISDYLDECDKMLFSGEVYYSSLDRDCLLDSMI